MATRATSQASAELRAYFAQVQSAQLTQDLLRRDGGGPDTPYTAETLARNFEQIAFYSEYSGFARSAGRLNRWDTPVRMEVIFGESVPASQRETDRRDVTAYAARLARLTGHPIRVGGPANFFVIFAGEDDRNEELDALVARLGANAPTMLSDLRRLRRDIYCAVKTYSVQGSPDRYALAIAIIRAENPDLLRLSCIHEELAQGLGLANDSPDARPSIFNDDDEFALLTSHDEQLLKMLYSPRLSTGMSLEDARPIVQDMARSIMGVAQQY